MENGVIYYKLSSTYDGDITKNCGLTGGEIDSNFLFLRGYDIESGSWDGDTASLNFTRINGEKIVIKGLDNKINIEGSYYDKTNGVLVLIINGEEYRINGFYVEDVNKEFIVYSDNSLNGLGTIANPLSLSKSLVTGFYAPAKSYVDLTIEGNSLPSGAEYADKVLTKEVITNYGLLYNFEGVKEVKNILESDNSVWRIPTNKEWGEMLNALELCNEDRTHLKGLSNTYYGKNAGNILKTNSFSWVCIETVTESDSKCIIPSKNVLPNSSYERYEETVINNQKYEISRTTEDGITVYDHYICDTIWYSDESSTIYQDVSSSNYFRALPAGTSNYLDSKHVQHLGKLAGFWSISQDAETDAWVRILEYNTGRVRQQGESLDSYFSLRLIRDFEGSIDDVEIINGLPYDTVLMPYVEIDEEGTIIKEGHKVWTARNVSFNELLLNSSKTKAIKIENVDNNVFDIETKYFLNFWNGSKWEKTLIDNNSMLILNLGPDGSENEEWQIINDQLVRRSQEIIDAVNNHTKSLVDELLSEHDGDIIEIQNNITNLRNDLINESNERLTNDSSLKSEINELNSKLDNEINDRINAINKVEESISDLHKAHGLDIENINTHVQNVFESLSIAINDEKQDRIESINNVTELIEKETSARIEAVKTLDSRISDLSDSLNVETEERTEKDNELDAKINDNVIDLTNKIETNVALLTEKINSNVDAINSNITTAVNELNTSISNEATERKNKDNELQENINKSVSDLTSLLNAEVDSREKADVEIYTRIQNEREHVNTLDSENKLEAARINATANNALNAANKAQSEVDALEVLHKAEKESLESFIDSINIRLQTVESTYAKSVDLITETNRAVLSENELNNLIGAGFEGKTVTQKINDFEDSTNSSIVSLNKSVTDNASAIGELNDTLKAFFNDAELGPAAIDTLKEIQNYITADGDVAAEMLNNITKAQNTADGAVASINTLSGTVDTIKADYLKTIDKVELMNSISSNKILCDNEINNVKNDITDVRSEFAAADTLLKSEIRNDYTTADTALASAIDIKINTIDEKLDEHISNSLSNNTSLSIEIVNLKNADNEINARITALVNKDNEIINSISNVNNDVITLNNDINTLKERVNNEIERSKEVDNKTTSDITKLNDNVNILNNNIITVNEKVINEIARSEQVDNEIKNLIGKDSVSTQISNTINTLNYSDNNEDGKFVSAVQQNNGKITVSKLPFSTIKEKEQLVDVIDLNKAIGEVNTRIDDIIAGDTDIDLESYASKEDFNNFKAIIGTGFTINETAQQRIEALENENIDLKNRVKALEDAINTLVNSGTLITTDNIKNYAVTSLSSATDDIKINDKGAYLDDGKKNVQKGDIIIELDQITNVTYHDSSYIEEIKSIE